MILECSKCHTSFNVPDNAIGSDGRIVRCSKCKNEWVAMPLESTSIDETHPSPSIEEQVVPMIEQPSLSEISLSQNQSTETSPLQVEEKKLTPRRRVPVPIVKIPIYNRLAFRIFSYILLISILFCLSAISFVAFKNKITTHLPKTQKIYDILGIYNIENLVFERVICKEIEAEAADHKKIGKELDIQIPIKNIGLEPKKLNSLRITLFDEQMRILGAIILQRHELIAPHSGSHLIMGSLERIPNESHYVSVEMGNPIEFFLYSNTHLQKIAIHSAATPLANTEENKKTSKSEETKSDEKKVE